jgi:hypothetical protein
MLYILSILALLNLDLEPAALTACNETGGSFYEGALVLQVAVNRSKRYNTSLNSELTKPYQFNTKPCATTEVHYLLAFYAHRDMLPTPSVVKQASVLYYDSQWSQDNTHRKCPGYTIGDVWEYAGLVPVYRSALNHIFYTPKDNKPGCPVDFVPTKRYVKFKNGIQKSKKANKRNTSRGL